MPVLSSIVRIKMVLEKSSLASTTILIIFYIGTSINTAAARDRDIVVPESTSVYNETFCPPWLTLNATGHCTCGQLDNQSHCNCTSTIDRLQKVSCNPENQTVTVCDGYLMTWSKLQNVSVISVCSGYTSYENCVKTDIPRNVLVNNFTDLNAYVCESLNRTGAYCEDCINGYGHAIFSVTPKCVECSEAQWIWGLLYLLLHLVCVTFFYLVFVLSKIKVTSSPLCALVLF